MTNSQSGQALIVVLLVMAVGLTVGLASVSRAVADIHISHQEEESARAFSAAEAGIEEALLSGADTVSGSFVGANYEVIANSESPEIFNFNGKKFKAGDTQSVWLVGHNASGEPDPFSPDSFPLSNNLDICWGSDPAAAVKPAVEVNLIYQNPDGSFGLSRGVFDADSSRGNNFNPADDVDGGNCDQINLAFAESLVIAGDPSGFSLPAGVTPYLLRLKLLYNNTWVEPLAVKARGDDNFLPSQGKCYESTATVTGSGVTRKVRQCQFYKAPPAIFDYSLYSESSLVK